MKICLLSGVNIKHMSGASPYLKFFKDKNIDYDIIYIDKYLKPEKINAKNIYRFELKIERGWSRGKKLREYYKFRKYAKEILKNNNYDLVIVWGTETAFLFTDYLIRDFKNKYIINIRDYARLNNKFKYFLMKYLVNSSKFTTISSGGFKEFLPRYNYILMNSVNREIIEKCNVRDKLRNEKEPIRISFIGYVRFYDNDKKLIKALANDERFILQYFGVGSDVLKDFAEKNEIYNIQFLDGFEVEETSKLLDQADIINNLYGYNDVALDTAISIKYHYAINLKLPILVYQNTYMEKISKGVSFVFDDNYENLGDRLYGWYRNINFNRFSEVCENKIKYINSENEKFYSKLQEVIGVS